MEIVNSYLELGSYRGAAEACATTHKTVKRTIEKWRAGQLGERVAGSPRERKFESVRGLVAGRVKGTDGRISAKRLLPEAVAAGYEGSDRNFRRLVADEKERWRRQRRIYRPWVVTPGRHLVIDWGERAGLQMFCAVLAWCRWRFVRFARDQRRGTTLGFLAELFAEIGGVSAVVLSDRMGCLRNSTVANVVVPHPDYIRFATHFGFRPDFCEAADPESKGMVEHLVGYAGRDLVVPVGGWDSVEDANRDAELWCLEVNSQPHTEIAAVPAERLVVERDALRPLPSLRPPLRRGETRKVDRLSTVRFGSARYSVPHRLVGTRVEIVAADSDVVIYVADVEVARHQLIAPGEVSVVDDHYGGPRQRPARAVRPRTEIESRFLALGPTAETFLRAAAAAGTNKLATELAQIVDMQAVWGTESVISALKRAITYRRFRSADVRAILEAAHGAPNVAAAGEQLQLNDIPVVSQRSLDAYAPEELS